MEPKIYQPEEDSYLLSRVLEEEIPRILIQNPNLTLLEIGCGSGAQLVKAEQLGVKRKNIFACDINEKAVHLCENKGFNCTLSNLFENISGKYDLIIFNPPYLPRDKRETKESQLATTGGKFGSEIINKFLKQAKDYIKPTTKIFLITSSLTKQVNFESYKKEIVGKKKIFFEELIAWKLQLIG